MGQRKTSVVIAYRNDPFIYHTVNGILRGVNKSLVDIIIVDDASDEPLSNDNFPSNVTIIRNESQRGVGHAFDRGVEECKTEDVVLSGSDVIVKDSTWIDRVFLFNDTHPNSFGCSVCLSGCPQYTDPHYPENDTKRYGATIMPFVTSEDLPSDSPILNNASYYVGVFDCKWIKRVPLEEVQEIPAIYGAFYFTTKKWYSHISGWDTIKGSKLSGFSHWGGLESWISLKTYLYGGACYVDTQIETLHIFRKFGEMPPPNGRPDLMWYNKAFICYTLLDEDDAERLLKKVSRLRTTYELPTLPFNKGMKLIKQNWEYVESVRDRNLLLRVHEFDWFCDKFNVKKDW